MGAPDNTPVAPKSAADRLASIQAGQDKAAERKLYRLSLNSTQDDPCPGFAPTVGGHAWHRETTHAITNEYGKDEIVKERGNLVWLTDREYADLLKSREEYVVRFSNRAASIAQWLDASQKDSAGNYRIVLNRETDVPAKKYLKIELVQSN